jgi:hypothetical protein
VIGGRDGVGTQRQMAATETESAAAPWWWRFLGSVVVVATANGSVISGESMELSMATPKSWRGNRPKMRGYFMANILCALDS